MDTKGLNDFDEDIEALIKDISCKESQTENTISNLLNNVDETFQDAENKIDTTIDGVNTKTNLLEQAVKDNLGSACHSLNKSKKQLDNNYSWYKYYFENSLSNQVLLLFIVAIFYDAAFSWFYQLLGAPYVGFLLFGTSVIPSIFFIIKIIWIVVIVKTIFSNISDLTDKMKIDTKILEKEQERLSQIDPTIGEIDISKQNFSRTRPLFSTAKNTFESLLFSLSKTSSTISLVYGQLTLMTKYGKIVDDFKFSLLFYCIPIDEPFFKELKERVPARAQIIDDENSWKDYIIEKIANSGLKDVELSKSIITLLYNEHNGENSTALYRSILESSEEQKKLANILIASKQLIQPTHLNTYSVQDISQLLTKQDSFDLSELNNQLSKSLRLLDYINSYVIFLQNNKLHVPLRPSINFLVNEEDKSRPDFEQQVIHYCLIIGKSAFDYELPTSNAMSDGFTRASISIKFQNEISLKKYACSISGINAATAIIKAYYEKSKETDRKTFVTLKELIDDLPLIQLYLAENDTIEFRFLRDQLANGEWYDSSAAYLKEFYEKSTNEIKEQIKGLEKFTILKRIVKDTFSKVKIGTVEKAIDAQVFGAYIILLHSNKGTFAPRINDLSIRHLDDQIAEKRWAIKTKEECDDAERKNGVRPKYDFVNFSDNTRIGVFGKGDSFADLQKKFLQDVKTILMLNKQSEPGKEKFEIGFVIQRISPTQYSLGILDESGISDFANIKNLDVAQHIAQLAVAHVSPEEQAGVIKHEKDMNILKILDHYSIYELIRIENDDSSEKERKVLESEELKREILQQLQSIGVNGFKSLAFILGKKEKSAEDIIKPVRTVFYKYFKEHDGLIRSAEHRADILSKRFVDVFDALYQLYEIQ